MNDLEKLLNINEFFDKLPEPEERTYTKASHLLRANGNASLLDFFDMVSLIITNTMEDLHVDCMPDEKAYVTKDDPVEAINHPIVTFKVNEREHKDGSNYKPRLIETVTENETGKTAFIYSERFLSKVQFNIMAAEYRLAWTVMDRIEDALISYAETIRVAAPDCCFVRISTR